MRNYTIPQVSRQVFILNHSGKVSYFRDYGVPDWSFIAFSEIKSITGINQKRKGFEEFITNTNPYYEFLFVQLKQPLLTKLEEHTFGTYNYVATSTAIARWQKLPLKF